jgi:hypothetical protein
MKKCAMCELRTIDMDVDKILEMDLLRWLLLGDNKRDSLKLIRHHMQTSDFKNPICRILFQKFCDIEDEGGRSDFFKLFKYVNEFSQTLQDMVDKKVDKNREKKTVVETLQRMVNRRWMHECEEIRVKIQSGTCNDDESYYLCKKFGEYKCGAPKVRWEDE